jgi:hypothetical protein
VKIRSVILFDSTIVLRSLIGAAAALGIGTLALAAPAGPSKEGASPLIPITQADVVGTDDLGRALPTFEETGPVKPNRYVGLFYWQWHGPLRAMPSDYNMTDFLQSHPKFMDFNAYPAGGPRNPEFYWAQPLFGCYRSTDPWVIRKHLCMFSTAGVDFLFMDYTNSSVYDPELANFLTVANDLKAKGNVVPRLTFFLNSRPESKVESLYRTWYKPGKYDDNWFRWEGKPLMMGPMPTDASKLKDPSLLKEIQDYFTWRPTWANQKADKTPGMWRFVADYDAKPATRPDGSAEQVVVNKSTGGPIWNAVKEGGVSAVKGTEHVADDYDNQWCLPDMAQGKFFQTAWDHAMQIAPPIVLVTGWNEWRAAVWETPGVVMLGRTTAKGQGHIVDEFNMQFNRDLEPMKGGYGDDYYWQFVENIRRYKGMLPPQPVSAPISLAMGDPTALSAEKWAEVTPVYHACAGSTADRDWDGTPTGVHYVNHSARNDIQLSQVGRDAQNVYFHVRTTAPLSPATDPNWMMLFIKTTNAPATGWNGFDLLINRTRKNGLASLERHTGDGWKWEKLTDVPAQWSSNDLVISVPRKYLAAAGQQSIQFDFKWADNLPENPEVMDFYTQGDTAPQGRFSYRFAEPAH